MSSEEKPVATPAKQSADDALPTVVAPGASFILQLFFIPLIIVLIIVSVWLMFGWLAQKGSNPHTLVEDIVKGDEYGWQRAATLADMLRNSEYEDLKKDEKLAGALAKALEAQIAAGGEGGDAENRLKLRVFICRALGEFKVTTVLPALIKAATEDKSVVVRRTAVEAMAVLAKNVGPETAARAPMFLDTLLATSLERPNGPDENHQYGDLRSTAAFALGVIGGEQALERLDRVQSDNYANARYNAATGLARHGDPRCIDVLAEMLLAENDDAVANELSQLGRQQKQQSVHKNALAATEMLADRNPTADMTALHESLEALAAADVHAAIKQAASDLAKKVGSRPTAAAAP